MPYAWRIPVALTLAGATALACRPDGPRRIEPGRAAEGALTPGEDERFVLDVPRDAYVEVVVEQLGIDLSLRAGPSAQEATYDLDRVGGHEGREEIAFVAERASTWSVELAAIAPRAAPGRFRLTVAVRPPSPEDRRRAAAHAETHRARRLSQSKATGADLDAERAWIQAEAMWRELDDRYFVAYALDRRGSLMKHLGRRAEGIELRREALEIREQIHDRFGVLVSAIGLGNFATYFGDQDTAITYYERALELTMAVNDGLGESVCRVNLGINYFNIARYDDALDSLQKAVEVLQANGQENKTGLAYHWMGATHLALGDAYRAIELLELALDLRTRFDEPKTVPEVLADLSLAYVELEDYERALELAQSALERRRALAFGSDREGFDLDRVAAIQRLRGRPDLAAPLHEQALAVHEANRSEIGVADNRRDAGKSLAALRRYDEAERALERSVALNRRLGFPREVAAGLAASASIAATRQDLDRALRLVEEATSIAESIRSQLGAGRNRSTYLASVRDLYDLHVDLALRRYRRTGREQDAFEAFRLDERARGRVMLERLRARSEGARWWAPREFVDARREQSRELRVAEVRLRAAVDAGDDDDVARERRAVDAILVALDRTDARIAKASPRFAALSQPADITRATIRDALPPHTTFVVFALGAEHAIAWRFSADRFDVIDLGPSQPIERIAREAHHALTARNRGRDGESASERRARIAEQDAVFEARARDLARRIVDPLGALDTALIVVPDGPLHLVPFAALPYRGAPLVETTSVVTAPSVSVVTAPRDEHRAADLSWVAVADPVFGVTDTRFDPSRPVRREVHATELARLPFSGREAAAIAELFASRSLRADVVQGYEATRLHVVNGGLAGRSIVHLATHAFVDDRRPERSALMLAGIDEAGAPHYGRLDVHEISGLHLEADLVVLSACASAGGRYVSGEGLVGLTRAFLFAGASSVLGSLWRVHDRGTGRLVVDFYRELLDGASPAQALRSAQNASRRDPRWASPYYWAPFVLHVARLGVAADLQRD